MRPASSTSHLGNLSCDLLFRDLSHQSPLHLGWPRQRETSAAPVLFAWCRIGFQGQHVQDKETKPVPVDRIIRVLQNSFLETSRLGPCHILMYLCSSGNPCTLFGLYSSSEVSPFPVTPSASNPLSYCSNLCRKECTASPVYSIEGEIFSTYP